MSFQPPINTDKHRYKRLGKQLLSAFICVHLWLFMVASTAYAQESITVAVASSLYAQMQTQAQSYEKEYDVKIRLVSGSTGRLYNQITQGAPFDVFIAADDIRPNLLLKQGKAIATYIAGQGYLGLIVHGKLVSDLTQLTQASIQHIAIANPDVAPFGLVTKEILQKQGLWKLLKPKFIYAQNALQTQMLVEKGLVDAGFVPVASHQTSMVVIAYHSVLLTDKVLARSWLKSITPQDMALKAP